MLAKVFHHPMRVVLDGVSSFLDGVTSILRAGAVGNTKFTVEFRTDMLKFLFGGKGEQVAVTGISIS